MESNQMKDSLAQLVAGLEEDAVLHVVDQRLRAGEDPLQIIAECNEGMREVGLRYEKGEFFVAGLIMSGEILREVVELVQPWLENQAGGQPTGRVIVGTVWGDIHDLGKNIFAMLLACHGFEVIDLGVDVPPAAFVTRAVETRPDVVCLSGLLTASIEMMKETVTALRAEAGPRLPVLIGGGSVDEHIRRYTGADFWMPDAMAGVRFCEELLGKK